MRYRIEIEWKHLLSFAIIITGLTLTALGLVRFSGMRRPLPLDTLTLSELHRGTYVSGQINELVAAKGFGYFSDKWFPVTTTDASTGTSWYVMPLGGTEDRYVSLIIPKWFDAQIQKGTLQRENNADMQILGKVVRGLKYGLNYDGLRSALNVSTAAEVDALVSPTYGIKTVDPESELTVLWVGVCLFLAGTVLSVYTFRDLIAAYEPAETPQNAVSRR